jgi:hypothetical protein
MTTRGSETPKSSKRSRSELEESESQVGDRISAQKDGNVIDSGLLGSGTQR